MFYSKLLAIAFLLCCFTKHTLAQDGPARSEPVTKPKTLSPGYPFTSAASFAAYVNQNMESVAILQGFTPGSKRPTSYKSADYKFTLLGKTDRIHPSFEFFAKEGKLYIRMYMPEQGDCRSGIVEIEAKQGRVKGWGDEVFSIKDLNYKRVCDGKYYNTITVYIYHRGDDQLSKEVDKWLEENTP